MTKIEDYAFPHGIRLLKRWQSGDADAKHEIREVFDAAIAGEFDDNYRIPAGETEIHATASVHMLTLAILHSLYGIESREYYHEDPYRFARTNLAVGRLLGVQKFFTVWAVYAWSCEPMGQVMMYPDKFPPGADPDQMRLTRDNWRDLETPDFTTGVPKAVDGILAAVQDLTGMAPLLHVSAPYSLAADTYGQEPLLADVRHDKDHANALLNHLGEKVVAPWIDHHMETFPNGWVEVSDASGSPFFIGPENCRDMSIRSILHMLEGKDYTERVYCNNYRGDYVTQVQKKSRGSRRRGGGSEETAGITLQELTDAKVSTNPAFIMRLQADQVEVSFYRDEAIKRNLPITLGIASRNIDRNSIADYDMVKDEVVGLTRSYIDATRQVFETIDLPEGNYSRDPWPSQIYLEDVNGESSFDLVEAIMSEVYAAPDFTPKKTQKAELAESA